MISYFPTPFENESLYSLVARYHKEVKNPTAADTYSELFDKKEIAFRKDMFNHAKILAEKLKHFNFLNAEEIISNLTHVKYYTIFGTHYKSYVEWMIENTRINEYEDIKTIVGRRDKVGGIYYRYCEKCVKSGRLYWNLNHNLPGSFYCQEHKTLLTNSDIEITTKKLVCLSDIKHASPNIFVSRKELSLLKKIQLLNEYLFQNLGESRGLKIQSYYHIFLHQKKYFDKRTGLYNYKKIQAKIDEVFTENICEILNVDLKKFKTTALTIFFSKHDYDKYQPLYQVMIMAFLGISIEDIQNEKIKTHLGDVKCENKSCKNYMKENLKFLTLDRNRGVFTCSKCEEFYQVYLS